MGFLRRVLKKNFQRIVDKYSGKPVDIISAIGYIITFIFSVLVLIQILSMFDKPIIKYPINRCVYTVLIILPLLTFYISLCGKYFKKPSRRLQQFIYVVITTSIFAFGYTMQITNFGILSAISKIVNIEVLPYSLIEGNIRLGTFTIPSLFVAPVFYLTMKLMFEQEIKMDLIDYEVDLLLPTVHKMDDTTVDLKICDDYVTGDDCTVPEKILNEHVLLQGGTGSGKTATYIKPILKQLYKIKAKLREKQKKLAYEALKEGIAVITIPITNYWFNKNFTMEFIKPKSGKEEEFKKKFKDYIIGVRDKETMLVQKESYGERFVLKQLKGDRKYFIDVAILRNGMEIIEKQIEVKKEDDTKLVELHKDHKPIIITTQTETELGKLVNKEDSATTLAEINKILDTFSLINHEDDVNEEKLYITLPQLSQPFKYKIKITEKDSGKIIYKGLGTTVIAPDGELAKDTIDIAKQFGVKVHKFDPSRDEIRKGGIAKFNPLAGEHPEKTGDIISSILVSMEHGEGGTSKSNPYFTNASVRAVRNITILLKVMYPKLKNRQPTLEDILKVLNNFKIAEEICEEMKKDNGLTEKYANVISYFEACFYAPEVDIKGRVMPGRNVGSQRKKTEEAISGIINQLDNFLGREEIKYILCPKNDEESLNLSEILEKGECIAISTRQSELGDRLGKAFALFFILSLQNEVLSRFSENENPEVPHYLIIDEFPFYINDMTKIFFTFARKYKCSITVAIQNLAQLLEISEPFLRTIFVNTATKMLLPKSDVKDREEWSKFFGKYQKFEMQTGVSQSSIMSDNPNYSEQRRGTITDKAVISEQDIADLKFQQAFYVYTCSKARTRIGKGSTDFMFIKQKEKFKLTEFDFEKYVNNEKNISLAEKLLEEERKRSVVTEDEKEQNETSHEKEKEIVTSNDNEETKEIVIEVEEGNDNKEASRQFEINNDLKDIDIEVTMQDEKNDSNSTFEEVAVSIDTKNFGDNNDIEIDIDDSNTLGQNKEIEIDGDSNIKIVDIEVDNCERNVEINNSKKINKRDTQDDNDEIEFEIKID